jgi:hypothetical protein
MPVQVTSMFDAKQELLKFALSYNVNLVLYGSGYELDEPHAVVKELDWVSGEGRGYFVTVYPTDWTPDRVKHHLTIKVA